MSWTLVVDIYSGSLTFNWGNAIRHNGKFYVAANDTGGDAHVWEYTEDHLRGIGTPASEAVEIFLLSDFETTPSNTTYYALREYNSELYFAIADSSSDTGHIYKYNGTAYDWTEDFSISVGDNFPMAWIRSTDTGVHYYSYSHESVSSTGIPILYFGEPSSMATASMSPSVGFATFHPQNTALGVYNVTRGSDNKARLWSYSGGWSIANSLSDDIVNDPTVIDCTADESQLTRPYTSDGVTDKVCWWNGLTFVQGTPDYISSRIPMSFAIAGEDFIASDDKVYVFNGSGFTYIESEVVPGGNYVASLFTLDGYLHAFTDDGKVYISTYATGEPPPPMASDTVEALPIGLHAKSGEIFCTYWQNRRDQTHLIAKLFGTPLILPSFTYVIGTADKADIPGTWVARPFIASNGDLYLYGLIENPFGLGDAHIIKTTDRMIWSVVQSGWGTDICCSMVEAYGAIFSIRSGATNAKLYQNNVLVGDLPVDFVEPEAFTKGVSEGLAIGGDGAVYYSVSPYTTWDDITYDHPTTPDVSVIRTV